MKKIFKLFLVLGLFISTGLTLVACGGKPKVKEIYVDLDGQTSISVQHKSNWDPAEELDVKGILSNGDEIDIDEDDCTFEGVDVNVADEQILTISYGAYETEVTVNVYEYVSQIAIQNGTIATEVDYNGTLDLSQAKLVVKYSNDATTVLNRDQFEISTPVTNVHGEQSLTISYAGKTIQFAYTVNKIVTNVEVIGNYASSALWGTTYNYDGVRARITYSDNTTEEKSRTDTQTFSITKNVNTGILIEEGTSVNDYFTVSYKGVTGNSAAVNVYVTYDKLEYVSGLETFLTNGIEAGEDFEASVKVRLVYTDPRVTEEATITNLSINTATTGAKNLTISYTEGARTQTIKDTDGTTDKVFVINVFEELKGIKAEGKTPTSKYFLDSDEIDKNNFNFSEVWSNREVAIDINNITLSAIQGNETDGYYVVASYTPEGADEALTTNIAVVIVDSWDEVPSVTLASISLAGSYETRVAHKEAYDYSGLKVVLRYSNGELTIIDYNGNEDKISVSLNVNTVGDQTLTVIYEDNYQVTEEIEVVKVFESFEIKEASKPTDNILWGTFDFLNNLKFLVKYSDSADKVELSLNEVDYDAFTMPTKEEFKNASAHELNKSITFRFTSTDCFANSTKEATLNFVVYEELIGLTVNKTALTRVDYSTTNSYAELNAGMKVYFEYTSGNLVDAVKMTYDATTGERNKVNGYEINTIDLTIPGKQPLYINYYIWTYKVNEETQEKIYYHKLEYTTIVSVMVHDIVTNYEITGVKTTVTVGSTVDYSSLALVPTFASGSTVTLGDYIFLNEGEYTPINTSEAGEKTLVVNYDGQTYNLTIVVLESATSYKFSSFTKPDFVLTYEVNSQKENTYTSQFDEGKTKGFNVTGNVYVVGNDNAFKFSPTYKVVYTEGSIYAGILENYLLKAEVYIKGEATPLVEGANEYYTFNGNTHEFNFTDEAIDKEFTIKVWPDNGGSKTEEGKYVEFSFKVVDGYNVYDAKGLSILDNYNRGGKWNEMKTALEMEISDSINAVIIHDNITITKDDIPAVHFYTASELNTNDPDYDLALGSLKDACSTEAEETGVRELYFRNIDEDESFTIEGNYFTLDLSKMPYIVREDNGNGGEVNADGKAVNSHVSVMMVYGKGSGNFTMNNVSWFGNAKKSDNVALSGGVMGIKATNINAQIYNNIAQAFYIPYFFNCDPDDIEGSKNVVYKLTKTNGFDAYNTFLYNWGAHKVYIDSCNLIGAGGPVMINDHVDNDEQTGAGGIETNVYLDANLKEGDAKSILESWVSGEEGWFQIFEGSGAIVSSLKALDPLLNAYYKSMLKDGSKINIIAVYKSGSAEGLTTSTIRGKFKVAGYNAMDLEGASTTLKQQVINDLGTQYATEYYAQTGSMPTEKQIEEYVVSVVSKIAILESVNLEGTANGIGVPLGQVEKPWLAAPDSTAFVTGGNYLDIYLFNGMAAVLGLEQLPLPSAE